jgi:hypothetical protein
MKTQDHHAARTALLACLLLSLGCSPSAGAGARVQEDAQAAQATSCVYQTRTATTCDDGTGTTVSDWQWTCNDEPCSQESWDPYPVAAGTCYGDTEYQGSFDYHATCDGWEAAGSPSAPPPQSPRACGTGTATSLLPAACVSCGTQYCCIESEACSMGSDCDLLIRCDLGCENTPACQSDAGTCTCLTTCTDQHTVGLQALESWQDCLVTNCASQCAASADGG